jgi:hypothetical protein
VKSAGCTPGCQTSRRTSLGRLSFRGPQKRRVAQVLVRGLFHEANLPLAQLIGGPAGASQKLLPGPVLHPRTNSSSNTDSSTLTAIEPRQPRRFENRKNISRSRRGWFAS